MGGGYPAAGRLLIMSQRKFWALAPLLALSGCSPGPAPLARDIYAPLGEIRPDATDSQRATFERGEAVAKRRFSPSEGLGPLMNVTFCAACHEKPVFGGGGAHYRDFYLTATKLEDGGVLVTDHGGVLTAYNLGEGNARPSLAEGVNLIAQRNPIPFFGVGLIAELPESSILANVDETDADGDGISGRPNYDRGFVGRFGRKAQTVSIEGFIRGPLNNHLGITTDPLTEEQKANLPVPSQTIVDTDDGARSLGFRQAAAPEEPLTDEDGVEDPEMASEDLFDLVSWAMLLAAPEFDEPTEESLHGQQLFDDIGCTGCHVPSLEGPRGRLPLYSDLLLHDMGPELGDGFEQGLATGTEFRTQPLWGVAAVGPYLHDGRADTLDQAIRMHAGEATTSAERYGRMTDEEREHVLAFLTSLGGAEQTSEGLLPPEAPIPRGEAPGAPLGVGDDSEVARWLRGRALFDRDMLLADGLGPFFNGDSCRACHFDPVLGGAGPLGVNVMRHGTDDNGSFIAPEYGTILPKLTVPGLARREHTSAHNVFEPRQTPTVFGLGLIESISELTIQGGADPEDTDGDGIYGVAHVLDDGRVGRFGWKANIPTIREFVRDAMSSEIGMTVPQETGQTFGFLTDEDGIPDPELAPSELDDLTYFLSHLSPPKPKKYVAGGIELFIDIGCGDCHVPEMNSSSGPVRLYSDLLLHRVSDETYIGIADGLADGQMFRTPPLWGLSDTGPYLHDGSAGTVHAAILAHAGEAENARDNYYWLSLDEQALLIDFLENL